MKNIASRTIFTACLFLCIFMDTGNYIYGSDYEKDSNETITPPPFGEVYQLGWIVKDIDKVINYWKKVGLDRIQAEEPVNFINARYRGKEIDFTVKHASTSIGGVSIAIYQPLSGNSAFDEFLEKHGEGIHHITFAMKSPGMLKKQTERLSQLGVKEIQRNSTGEKGTIVFFDTAPIGGICIALMYDPLLVKSGNISPNASAKESHKYPFSKIIQYATAVRDIDKVAEFYNKIGLTVSRIDRDNKGLIRRYRGKDEDLRMHMGWSKLGSVTLEILHPTKGRNIYDDYLDKYGEGFHHLAFSVDDMDEAVKLFKSRGVEVSQDGAWGKTEVAGRFAYLETDIIGGLCIELLWSKK